MISTKQDSSVNINCGQNDIKIHFGEFGNFTSLCFSEIDINYLKVKCSKKNSCSFKYQTDYPNDDPCPNKIKYHVILYECYQGKYTFFF